MATASKAGRDATRPVEDRSRLPHERDEAPDAPATPPRGVMRQAADDLARGLVDTDLHGARGIEEAVPHPKQPGQARPRPDAAAGMRHANAGKPPERK